MRYKALEIEQIRLVCALVLSLGIHGTFVTKCMFTQVKPIELKPIEKVPVRFVKLIVNKPIPSIKMMRSSRAEYGVQNTSLNQAIASSALEFHDNLKIPLTSNSKTKQANVPAYKNSKQNGITKRTIPASKSPADILGMSYNSTLSTQLSLLNTVKEINSMNDSQTVYASVMKSKSIQALALQDYESSGNSKKTFSRDQELLKKAEWIIQKPKAITGKGVSASARNYDHINKRVALYKSQVLLCYKEFLNKNPELSGKITLRFTITNDGLVNSIEVIENTTGNVDFADALVGHVKEWKFDSIPNGEVTVTYPFVFTNS